MNWQRMLGIQAHSSWTERAVSALGGLFGIALVYALSSAVVGHLGALAILPSMGAAAVLVFAVPHGPMSQPWALVVGNGLSAAVGVACAQAIANPYAASALAVALAIAVMHVARCLHPPGGATALAAVIGGADIHALGYAYIYMPTLLNCLILLVVAVVFNYAFHWRRYPLGLMHYTALRQDKSALARPQVEHISQAIDQLDVMVDISAEQIKRIMDKAYALLVDQHLRELPIELGAFYTNGEAGRAWQVRQVVDESAHSDPARHTIIYRTVEGNKKAETGACSLLEFSQWAKERMRPVNAIK